MTTVGPPHAGHRAGRRSATSAVLGATIRRAFPLYSASMPLYAVTRRPGAGWRDDRSLQDQVEFERHAQYMNDLHARGAVVFGGCLDDGPEVLLIMPDAILAERGLTPCASTAACSSSLALHR